MIRVSPPFLAAMTALVPVVGAQTTRTVPTQYPTINAALGASSAGDTVLVLPGTYVENVSFAGLDVTLRSAQGAGQTTIDGAGAECTVIVAPGATRATLIEGFTITGGRGSFPNTPGGGISIRGGASPTIRDCIVRGNSHPNWGGGIGAEPGSFALVDRCLVEQNTATGVSFAGGGGIAFNGLGTLSPTGIPEIVACTIRDNTAADRGGGLFFAYFQNAIVRDCVITRNRTNNRTGQLDGGAGVYYCLNSRVTLVNDRIFANVSNNNGGGVKFFNVSGGTVLNCTIVSNTGGSIAGFSNTGVFGAGTNSSVVNCICWNNGATETAVNTSGSTIPVINMSYTDIAGGYAGTGNINANPLIANLLSDNLRLLPGSPCTNAGDNSATGLPVNDFEGDARIVAGTVDVGADESTGVLRTLLAADRGTVSAASPGAINFTLTGGVGRAGKAFIVLPGISGTRPGLDIGPHHLPLNFDNFSIILLNGFAGTLSGFLDGSGNGIAAMNLGPAPIPDLAGLTLSFAAVVIDVPALTINGFSNDENVDGRP